MEWVARAGLEPYVRCVVKSSDNPENVAEATAYFGQPVQSVFIDSSHNYAHTRRELNLWVAALAKGGLVFMHDVTDLAKSYDSTKTGGVKSAALEFLDGRQVRGVLIDSAAPHPVYRDPCGLGILQKI
jgi:kynurenine formamidase